MKPCGKKKPDNQKERGWPFVAHSLMKLTRSFRSKIHEPSFFKEGYAMVCQLGGTLLFRIDANIKSSSWLMSTIPFTALIS